MEKNSTCANIYIYIYIYICGHSWQVCDNSKGLPIKLNFDLSLIVESMYNLF